MKFCRSSESLRSGVSPSGTLMAFSTHPTQDRSCRQACVHLCYTGLWLSSSRWHCSKVSNENAYTCVWSSEPGNMYFTLCVIFLAGMHVQSVMQAQVRHQTELTAPASDPRPSCPRASIHSSSPSSRSSSDGMSSTGGSRSGAEISRGLHSGKVSISSTVQHSPLICKWKMCRQGFEAGFFYSTWVFFWITPSGIFHQAHVLVCNCFGSCLRILWLAEQTNKAYQSDCDDPRCIKKPGKWVAGIKNNVSKTSKINSLTHPYQCFIWRALILRSMSLHNADTGY